MICLCGRGKKWGTKAGTPWSSQAVPHHSTNQALGCLTSEVGRDLVLSTRYGRQRHEGNICLECFPCFCGHFCCNLRGHLQRCQMPDIENSRKTAEKGAEWVTVNQPKNSRKNTRNTRKTPESSQNSCFSGVSGVFPAVFRLFYRDPLGTLFGCFSAVFQCRAFGTSVGGRGDCNTFA